MSDIYFLSTNQISESYEGTPHVYPKYGKSTTDPSYYEPAATRIANMRKTSGVKLQGIYDFYEKDDVSKFNEQNFKYNISNAMYDPRYNNNLTREEISQATNNIKNKVDETIQKKKQSVEDKQNRINEQLEVSDKIVAKAAQSSEE